MLPLKIKPKDIQFTKNSLIRGGGANTAFAWGRHCRSVTSPQKFALRKTRTEMHCGAFKCGFSLATRVIVVNSPFILESNIVK